ncbi:hypothetical protein Smp_021960 [Schistosoma mansoni]|uniref:hypothetical protein n=1 Tax=Schistosoma mansoni TaxID=6183 RepID=UPI00022DC0B6|nr:hypothetical protein Smp_021960 [Schistosoma mansoni]|eukprot:XP_018649682.1 hypothetical protein Smp_021960 [Schistosoma mansoni]
MDLTLPELNHNCFSTLDHSSDNSGNSVSINHSFALIDCKNPQNEQLHGAISVRSWINSANNDYLEENLGDLRKCLMQKILEFNCHSTSHIPTPAITKLYESLICLYFKTPKLWSHPLRWIIEVLIHADSLYASTFNPSISDEEIQHCLTNSAFSKQIKGNILHLLSLISEEFTTAQLTHSVKCIIKEGIHSDEILVRNILKQFINDVNHEEIRSLAIHTSAIWMSNFVLNNCHSSSADSYLDIVHIIYNSMQYSEDLYLTGINALINIFESDGVGLNSDRDKGFLLDFHVSELTKFKCTLQHLVELHSVNLQNGVQWNECKGYEALNKTVLLLSILSEKQMDYLIHRLSNSCDNTNNQYIHELFGMFLLTFSLTGHYPYDEDISDVALQIWLNIYEASISTTAYTVSNVHDEDAIKRIHTEFLQRAFIKFHYPKDLNQYYTVWNQEDRDLWLKFRQELSNCFLSVFRYLNLHDWFLQATNQLQSTICNCTNEELLANWQIPTTIGIIIPIHLLIIMLVSSYQVDLNFEKYNKLDETILKPIQYFIEWLFNDQSNMNEHSSFINLASSLLSNILDKINILLINQTIIVDDKLFGKYIGYTKEERINHPLSPILMSFIGQSITEEIEISSRFISQLISFKSQSSTTKGNQQRKSIFNLLNDDAHMSLKLFLSLAFSGISVPEWSTVESCIQLACHLLTILTYENNIDPLMILDDKLLFEINICILLILTKGVPPPEKLLIKYAELYCCLANLFPCKQFIFLSFITGNIQSISQEYQLKLTQIPHSNILIELITDCLCYTSLTERAQFVIMVTRPSLSLNKVTRSISTFIRLLSLQRHGNC